VDTEQIPAAHRAPPGPGRAVALAVASIVVAVGLNAGFTYWSVQNSRQAERQAGISVERKICTTLAQLAALKPPAGNPRVNPSRAFDDRMHATLAQLGPDLGCT
jgi:hypothetical protein